MRCPLVWLAAILPAVLEAQPAPQVPYGGVVSAADNSSADGGLARGSLVTIYGANLAERAESAPGAPLPLTLGGARVQFRAAAGEFDAPILYASPAQINAVVPAALPPGSAEVRVRTGSGESTAQTVPIVAARFTAVTTNGRPFGPAIIQQQNHFSLQLNRLLNPAVTGDALVIWGTGLGGERREDVTVSFGLVDAKPFYAGPAPGLAGADQINVFLPAGVSGNCFVPFTVTAGGVQSSVYTVSTGGGGGCSMLFALGREGLAALDSGGVVRITGMTIQDSAAEAWTGEYDAAYLSLLATYDLQPFAVPLSCTRRGYGYSRFHMPVRTILPAELYGLRRVPDPLTVAVTGPGECGWPFVRGDDGVYRATAPPGCPARDYAIRNPASNSMASGNVPSDLPLPAFPQVAFDPAAGTVAWSANFSGRLTLELASSFTLPGNIFNGQTEVRELSCRLSGNSGAVRLEPADLMWALGLVTTRSAAFHQWTGGLTGGSWGGPSEALHIRILREQEQPVALY